MESAHQRIESMEDKVTTIEKKVNEIHSALVGDNYDSERGIVPRLKKLESYVDVDKKLKWIGGGIVLTIGATLGGLGKTLMSWISNHI